MVAKDTDYMDEFDGGGKIEIDSNNRFCTNNFIGAGSMIVTNPMPIVLHITAANVAIHANGHVTYDESKTDESARKFWEAVRCWFPGMKEVKDE